VQTTWSFYREHILSDLFRILKISVDYDFFSLMYIIIFQKFITLRTINMGKTAKRTVWRSAFLLISALKIQCHIHSYRLLFRQFCPLGYKHLKNRWRCFCKALVVLTHPNSKNCEWCRYQNPFFNGMPVFHEKMPVFNSSDAPLK